ncbi:MAG: hypothetical protein ACK52K_18400 [Alphaproteobacteria bacterium]|jgi:hypothetical protein
MAQLFWLSGQQLSDGNGAPHIAAKAYFYETGTTTPKATYSDAGLTSVNANPVVADANGRFGDIYLVAGRYKVVLTTSADVAIDTLDPVDGTSQIISVASAPATAYPFLRYHNTTDGNVYRRNAANSAWILEGGVDSLINAANVSEVLTGTDATKAVTPDALAGLWQRGTDIASASTLSLPATGGGVFTVTGTTTVTGISTGPGGRRITLRFAGSLTLTHNGTSFILPGAANIQTSAGDVADFINDAAQDATGSNWRCVNFQFANGAPLQTSAPNSQTATYTATDADRGKLVRFSGLGSDVTLNLPAAAGRAGFVLYMVNDDTNDTTGYGVIVDPSGSETIDGFSTRKGYTGTRVTLLCDGTGWRTVSGNWRYFSGDQTITAGGPLTLPHGLGIRPKTWWLELRCTTAENGYSVGDIYGDRQHTSSNVSTGVSATLDATNLNVRYGAAAATFTILNKTTGADANITNANWRARFWAED